MRAMFELVEDNDEALRAASWPEPHPAHDLDLGDQGEPGPARQLHPRGLHGRSDLDRHAEANATLAGLFRRAFIKEAR